MATYTFITDYKGGTYISQLTAEDLRSACFRWKDNLVTGKIIEDLDLKAFDKAFEADIDELPPVEIDSVSNVWFFQLHIGKDFLIVHIIQTELSTTDAFAASSSGSQNF